MGDGGAEGFGSRLLRQEMVVSLGCTEPAALGLAAAAASALLEGALERVRVVADVGTFKNALAVGLPGTDHRGPPIAAAAGALVAEPARRLRIFEGATPDTWERAATLAAGGRVDVRPEPSWRGVRIEADVVRGRGSGGAVVEGRHDRVRALLRNGEDAGPAAAPGSGDDEIDDEEIRRRLSGPRAILAHHAELSASDLERVREGIELNVALARHSLDRDLGLGLGGAYASLGTGVATEVKSWVAAGVEARMAGAPLPVMTSGGSGNSGLTVTLGAWAAARALGVDDPERTARATALAHLFNVAVKARIGRVGPLCGGTAASALGVACAIAWLEGGDALALDRVVRHMVNALAGTLCDGAKPACAMKIAAGLSVAVDAGLLAARGTGRPGCGGLAGPTAEDALERLHRLAAHAYPETDAVITEILSARDLLRPDR